MTIIITLCVALLYIVFAVYLMNVALVWQTIIGSGSFTFKLALLFELLGSMWTTMSGLSLLLLCLTGVLVGANVVLLVRRMREARARGTLGVLFGGASIVGLLASGCAACGAPLLGLFGLGLGVVAPVYFTMLSLIAIITLGISLYFLSREVTTCII